MKNELMTTADYLVDLKNMKQMCHELMQTPHYQKMKPGEMFAIVTIANAMKIHPLLALNGGLYPVNGKIEMSARLMGQLIREKGHSLTVSKDEPTICTVHGKRGDNGDAGSASFTIDEARKAGLVKKDSAWDKFPKDMLYSRALSRLARRLFPDVISVSYVESEISSKDSFTPMEEAEVEVQESPISDRSCAELQSLLDQVPEYAESITEFMAKRGLTSLEQLPEATFNKIKSNAEARLKEVKESAHDVIDSSNGSDDLDMENQSNS